MAGTLLLLTGLLAVGCNALDADKAVFADARAKGAMSASSPPGPNASRPSATVEFRSPSAAPQPVKIALEGDAFHVQQAMEKAGAWKKYSRMNVELTRKTPQGRWTKMAVSCDRGKRKVDPQCDYQILPGDVLIIKEDPSTIVDDMLSKVSPIRSMLTR